MFFQARPAIYSMRVSGAVSRQTWRYADLAADERYCTTSAGFSRRCGKYCPTAGERARDSGKRYDRRFSSERSDPKCPAGKRKGSQPPGGTYFQAGTSIDIYHHLLKKTRHLRYGGHKKHIP